MNSHNNNNLISEQINNVMNIHDINLHYGNLMKQYYSKKEENKLQNNDNNCNNTKNAKNAKIDNIVNNDNDTKSK